MKKYYKTNRIREMLKPLATLILFIALLFGTQSSWAQWSPGDVCSFSTAYSVPTTPRDNRGIAISNDGQYLYLGYNNPSPDFRRILLSSGVQYGGNTTDRAKNIAIDDQGRVYQTGTDGNPIKIYSSDLSTLLFSVPMDKCEGIAVKRESGNLYLYATERNLAQLKRFQLTESGANISAATLNGLDGDGIITITDGGSSGIRGVAVGSDGKILISNPGLGKIIKLNADGSGQVSYNYAANDNAYYFAFIDGQVFVTHGNYAGGTRVAVINYSNMTLVGNIIIPFASLGYKTTDAADMISGIAVAPDKKSFYLTYEDGSANDDSFKEPVIKVTFPLPPSPITNISTPSEVSCGVYNVEVKVSDFKNVGTISQILNYNPTVLSYLGVTLNNAISSASTNGTIAGKFILGYYGSGVTLNDDDVLFTLHFNLLPTIAGTTNLSWSTIQGECEYAGPGGDPVYTSTFNDIATLWTIPTRPVKNTTTLKEYCTIQAAIDDPLTTDGHTITVAAGTYAENVNITKNISLIGAGKNSTIIQPASLLATGVAHKYDANMNVALFVNGKTSVTVKDLTVDGNNLGANAVVFWNASSGLLENVKILNPMAFSGIQTGQGLAVDATAPASVTLNITNCDFLQWNKNAIDAINGNGATSGGGAMTINVTGGTIVGRGAQASNAQNGILFWARGGGNVTGTIDGASISGLQYTGSPSGQCCAILLLSAQPLSVSNCTFTNIDQYITNYYGGYGMYSGMVNATVGNTFDGVSPTSATIDQLGVIEDKMGHKMDDFLGNLIMFKTNNVVATTTNLGIAKGVEAASSGWTVDIVTGTHTLTSTLYINKPLTILGASEAGTIIDLQTVAGYGFDIQTGNITMKDFTVLPNPTTGTYTLKTNPIGTTPWNNLTYENITINGAKKTPFDIHGFNTVSLTNLTATGTISGNGFNFSGCNGVTMSGITATSNAWGAIAVSVSTYVLRGTTNLTFDFNTNTIDDFIYIEDENGYTNSSITVLNWTYGLNNQVTASHNFTAYMNKTKTDALNLGAALNVKFSNMLSYCWDPTITTHHVGPGMSIQRAINKALNSYFVDVVNGTYPEDVDVNKQNLTITGESRNGVIVKGLYTNGATNNATLRFANTGADGAIVKNMTITRDYQDWYGSNKNYGVMLSGAVNNITLENLLVKDNRNGVYAENNGQLFMSNCFIEENRTGIQISNTVRGNIHNNIIRNNQTHGLFYNLSDLPVNLSGFTFNDNSLYGNWYSQVTFRGTGTLSAQANFECNWFGTNAPTTNATDPAEPGYSGIIPQQLGGTSPATYAGEMRGNGAPFIDYVSWRTGEALNTSDPFVPIGLCNGTPVEVTLNAKTDVTCFGGSDGAIDINVSGGSGTYTYLWIPGNMTSQDITGLTTGTYTVTITDSWGNTAILTVTIGLVDHPAPVISQSNGAITVECLSAVIEPTPPTVTDFCGTTLIPIVTFVDNPNPLTCAGTSTRTYTFTYTDYQSKTSTWEYIYTIHRTTPPVVPANGTSTVACESLAVPPASLEVLDQQQLQVATDLTSPNWTDFTSIGQSFTCGVTGKLTKLDLRVASLVLTQNFILKIYQGNGIAGTLLYSGSHSLSSTGWQSLNIAENIAPQLIAGQQYTFWLTSFSYNQLGLLCMHPNAYFGGVSMDGCTTGCSPTYAWQQWPDYDLVFKTYMTTLPVVMDACGTVIPTPTPAITGTYNGCSGTRIYTYTYTDCAGLSSNWVYTYTISPPVVTMPTAGGSTVACVASAIEPTPPTILDNCGRTLTVSAGVPGNDPACTGTKTWTFTYTACNNSTYPWVYTYTIGHTTPPSEFGDPVSVTGTAQCYDAAIAPTTLPVFKDVCGNIISTPTPVITGTATSNASCGGTVIYTYTYTDCANLSTNWVYTYTLEHTTPPAEFGGPLATTGTAQCFDAVTAPTNLPVFKDVCGNIISTPSPVISGTATSNASCGGTVIFTYTYTDCASLNTNWAYTYTLGHTTPPTEIGGPIATSAIVECETSATAPTTLPVVKDVCGNTLSPIAAAVKHLSFNNTFDATPGAWYVDRYAPAGFTSPVSFDGGNRLMQSINAVDGLNSRPAAYQSAFYNTQGKAIDVGSTTNEVQIQLYIPASWETTNKRMAGLWGVPVNASNAVSGYPIIEFTSDGNNPRFRAYDNGNWVDMGLPSNVYGSWITLKMRLLTTGEFLLSAGSLNYVTTGLATAASVRIKSAILQGHNYQPLDVNTGITYDIYWDNFRYNDTYSPLACEGAISYTYDYVDCAGLPFAWSFIYNIKHSTPPAEFGGPVSTTGIAECFDAALAPTTLPVFKDVCGNDIPTPTPIKSGTATSNASCGGTVIYTYTYTDCANLSTNWVYTYTIGHTTPPSEFGDPVSVIGTAQCYDAAIAPTTLPVFKDVCGNIISTPTPVITGTATSNASCGGTVIYTYTYTDCANLSTNWVYTYTLGHTTPPTIFTSAPTTSAVECESEAVAPSTLPVFHDVCGNTATRTGPVMDASNFNGCSGTITYTYTFTDCANLSTPWTYTYSIHDITAPVITCPQPITVNVNQACTYVGSIGVATATDNCIPTASIVITNDAPAAFPIGPTTVIWKAIDLCGNEITCTQTVTVIKNTLSGTLTYNNTNHTALNNVILSLNPGGATYTTDNSGNYAFTDLCAGNYTVAITNINKPVGGINATDAAQVNAWGVGPQYSIEKVRYFAGDVVPDNIILANDAGRILQYFVTAGNPAINPNWKFWLAGATTTTNNNAYTAIPITISAGANTINLYGQCSGDFNGSFTPGALKTSSDNLTLNKGQNIHVEANTVFELPVYAAMDMNVSAISMIMNFPSNKVEVMAVYLTNDPTTPLSYNVNGDELRVGWNSLQAVSLLNGQRLFTLKLKIKATSDGNDILFTLAGNPLNELADETYNVINNAQLTIDMVNSTALSVNNASLSELNLINHPNPFKGTTTIDYTLPFDGKVVIEIFDILGQRVSLAINEYQTAGAHTLVLDANSFAAGMYACTLKLTKSGKEINRTIKIMSK